MERVIVPRSELTWGKRILYGIGGFFGANLICNIWSHICEALFWSETDVVSLYAGMGAIILGCVIILRWMWKNVKHESTRTGITVSIIWQILLVFVLLQAL